MKQKGGLSYGLVLCDRQDEKANGLCTIVSDEALYGA